jgi:hypothetical protein
MAMLWSGPEFKRPALALEESTLSGTFVNGDEVGAHESDVVLLAPLGGKVGHQTSDMKRRLIWGMNSASSRSVKSQKEHSFDKATRVGLYITST